MNRIILMAFVISLILIVGCQGVDLTKVSDKDIQRISEQVVVCKAPYMRFGTGCCLDQNNNNICDKDEATGYGLDSSSQEKETSPENQTVSSETIEASKEDDIPLDELENSPETETKEKINPIEPKETRLEIDISDYPKMFLIGKNKLNVNIITPYQTDFDSYYSDISADLSSNLKARGYEIKYSAGFIGDITETSSILIGTACHNGFIEEIFGLQGDCKNTNFLFPGQARIKLLPFSGGNSLIITGYSPSDVKLAANMLLKRTTELQGNDIIIEGVTDSDATVDIIASSKITVFVPSEE